MLISEENLTKFIDQHLNPSSFDINIEDDGFYEKYVKDRPRITYYPKTELQGLQCRTDYFNSSPDKEFPVKYYHRQDLSIDDISMVKWVSLSGNSSILFDRVNDTSFHLHIRDLTVNSFKEIVQYATSTKDIHQLTLHL